MLSVLWQRSKILKATYNIKNNEIPSDYFPYHGGNGQVSNAWALSLVHCVKSFEVVNQAKGTLSQVLRATLQSSSL